MAWAWAAWVAVAILCGTALCGCGGGAAGGGEPWAGVELREGDLVFRRGSGVASRAVMIAEAGAGTYSHVGVVVAGGRGVSGARIVHIEPGGREIIKMDEPGEFFAKKYAKAGAVMRVQCSDSVSVMAAREALRLAGAAKMKFDHEYDLTDTTAMYCTELVWQVFRRAGLDLTGGRRTQINLPGFRGDYILPTDIAECPELEKIYEF